MSWWFSWTGRRTLTRKKRTAAVCDDIEPYDPADRPAEASVERPHPPAPADWGYGRAESLTQDRLIDESYRGIRLAPG